MIGYLSGRAAAGSLVLVGGVGYLVHTPHPLPVGTDVELWIHTAVRETDISLYGFSTAAERDLFDCLTKVTGVGPKVALALLSLGAGTVVTAIRDGDARTLAKAPGIGVKKAQGLLTAVNLPADLTDALATSSDPLAELVDALTALGFDAGSARTALETAAADGIGDESTLMRRAMSTLRAA